MAIKVKLKNKDKDKPEGAEAEGAEVAEEGELLEAEGAAPGGGGAARPVDPIDDLLERDILMDSADKSIGWVAQNRGILIGVFVVAAVVSIGLLIWQHQQETSTQDNSRALTAAVDILNAEIEGAEPEIPSLEDPKKPKKERLKFKSEKERLEALDAKADEALAVVKGGSGQGMAELMKARAAAGLGRHDEAIMLYKNWLGAHPTGVERGPVLQALASVQAQASKPEDASQTLNDLKALDEKTWGEYALYQTARAWDIAGNKENARSGYSAFIKSYPESERVEWARMRLDSL